MPAFCYHRGMASLYKDLVRARIPTDHHESDLYVLDTPEARETVKKYGYKFTTFTSNIDGKRWIDVPFAYEPFWEKKQQAQRGSPKGERTLEAATGPNVPYEWPKKARKGALKKRSHATKKSPATKRVAIDVAFRVFPEGDVIALFPKEDEGRGQIGSYQHLGQHGGADRSLLRMKKAAPSQYASLLAELKSIGYVPRILKR